LRAVGRRNAFAGRHRSRLVWFFLHSWVSR
jgi:hypothetical protein